MSAIFLIGAGLFLLALGSLAWFIGWALRIVAIAVVVICVGLTNEAIFGLKRLNGALHGALRDTSLASIRLERLIKRHRDTPSPNARHLRRAPVTSKRVASDHAQSRELKKAA